MKVVVPAFRGEITELGDPPGGSTVVDTVSDLPSVGSKIQENWERALQPAQDFYALESFPISRELPISMPVEAAFAAFDELREGQAVTFEKGQGPKGPRGENVKLA